MKQLMTIFSITCTLMSANLYSQANLDAKKTDNEKNRAAVAEQKFIGFFDKDEDGVNDKFLDANGDGKNDVDGKKYPHKFEFKDKNNDKINDLWIDRDGDGVNDFASRFQGNERKDIHRNVVDIDNDGRNDITGASYDRTKLHWRGEVWGFWDESKGKVQGRFIDMDGDGIDDRVKDFSGYMRGHAHGSRMRDVFIDEDGDGICDGRTDFLGKMGGHGRKDNHDSRRDGGGHHH